jgi:predicted DNA binding CopG/RHH family protein
MSNKERVMAAVEKIEGTVENWESGALGRDPLHAKRAPKALEKEMDDAQGLQAISIRLKKDLIEDFKFIAKHHGMGYQPLMRQALKLFTMRRKLRLKPRPNILPLRICKRRPNATTDRPRKARQQAGFFATSRL